jgi:hypothetical protein
LIVPSVNPPQICGYVPPNERVIYLRRLVQLLPLGYPHCNIDKQPMKAVS